MRSSETGGAQKLIEAALAIAPQAERTYPELPSFRRKRELDVTLLKSAAEALEIGVTPVGRECVRLERDGRVLHFFQNMCSTLSVLDRLVTNDKALTKHILESHGLPVARGELVTSPDELLEACGQLGGRVVVKPLSGSGGRGVTVGLQGADQLRHASQIAFSRSRQVLVEECIDSVDLRVMVAGGRAIAVQMRVPANVIGDGFSSVATLIEKKNAKRAKNAYLRSGLIVVDDALVTQLGWRGINLDQVPPEGQRVFLHFKANLSSGGDNVALEHCIHPGLLRLAERALEPFGTVYHAGVDLLVQRIDRAPEEQRCVVCEINCNNEHPIHLYPSFGEPLDAAGLMLSRYFSDDFDEFFRRIDSWRSPSNSIASQVVVRATGNPAVDWWLSDAGVGTPVQRARSSRSLVAGIDLESIDRVAPEVGAKKYSRSLVIVSPGASARVIEPTGRAVFSSVASRETYLHRFLKMNQVPHCAVHRFSASEFNSAADLFSSTSPWAVRRTSGKNLWWAPINTLGGLKRAWSRLSSDRSFFAREASEGVRVRVLTIDGMCVIWRLVTPAGVVGDGLSSVATLIEKHKRQRDENLMFSSIVQRRDPGSQANLRRFKIDPEMIPEKGQPIRLGVSPYLEYGADLVELDGCPVEGMEELVLRALSAVGRPPLAAVGLAVRSDPESSLGEWKIEEIDVKPSMAEFDRSFDGRGSFLYRRVSAHLERVPGYHL